MSKEKQVMVARMFISVLRMVDTQRLVYECNLEKKGHQVEMYSTFRGKLLKKKDEKSL